MVSLPCLSRRARLYLLAQSSDSVLSFDRRGDNPVSGFSIAKKRLDRFSDVTSWRLHDLRRTAGTNMARLKVADSTVSRVLNHAEVGVTRIYRRYGYLDEKREALDRWSKRLEVMLKSDLGKTVPLRN